MVWNDVWMIEWRINDGMTYEWWNDKRMTKMTQEWLKWDVKDILERNKGGSGVIVHPLFQNKSIHWMMEWQENDLNDTGMTGMSQEWQNDNEMIEWQWNDRMAMKW